MILATIEPTRKRRRCLGVSRAKQCFGFDAGTRFSEGIQKTVSWFRANRHHLREMHY